MIKEKEGQYLLFLATHERRSELLVALGHETRQLKHTFSDESVLGQIVEGHAVVVVVHSDGDLIGKRRKMVY